MEKELDGITIRATNFTATNEAEASCIQYHLLMERRHLATMYTHKSLENNSYFQ